MHFFHLVDRLVGKPSSTRFLQIDWLSRPWLNGVCDWRQGLWESCAVQGAWKQYRLTCSKGWIAAKKIVWNTEIICKTAESFLNSDISFTVENQFILQPTYDSLNKNMACLYLLRSVDLLWARSWTACHCKHRRHTIKVIAITSKFNAEHKPPPSDRCTSWVRWSLCNDWYQSR